MSGRDSAASVPPRRARAALVSGAHHKPESSAPATRPSPHSRGRRIRRGQTMGGPGPAMAARPTHTWPPHSYAEGAV